MITRLQISFLLDAHDAGVYATERDGPATWATVKGYVQYRQNGSGAWKYFLTDAGRNCIFNEIELQARVFAESAHGDQKYGDKPYVTHLIAVRNVLKDFGFNGDLGVAAWLHDVVEDTDVDFHQLDNAFGELVTRLVWAVTGVGSDRRGRNKDAYAKMRDYPRSIILKLADRIANVESSSSSHLQMYRDEWPTFYKQLHIDVGHNIEPMWQRLADTFHEK